MITLSKVYIIHQKHSTGIRRNDGDKYTEGKGDDHLTKDKCTHGVEAQVPSQDGVHEQVDY